MRQHKKGRFEHGWHIAGRNCRAAVYCRHEGTVLSETNLSPKLGLAKLRCSLHRTLHVRFRSAARFSSHTALIHVRNAVPRAVTLGILLIASSTGIASAVQSSSASYGVDETFFGSGGELNACSTSYCTKQSAGETAVGNSGSASYQIQAGNNTFRDNSLEMIVNAANIDLGVLTNTSTKTASATFSVKSYLASGYAVYTHSPGPKNSSHILQALGVPSSSATGSEQFGINLVANTCPANSSPSGLGGCSGGLGADPQEVPDSTFSFGQAAAGYNTADSYKYVDGDVIAYSNTSSGQTDYTISYLYNISPVTPGGSYKIGHVLVATSTF